MLRSMSRLYAPLLLVPSLLIGGQPVQAQMLEEVIVTAQKRSQSLMDVPLPGASPDMAQYNDQIVMDYLEQMDRQDIVNRVRRYIIADLASGTLSKQAVADKMHMSPRNLQLKLAAEDTTFQDILDSTRQSLATGYMEQSHLAITEIAYLLGFSDASNFTRAFRRWYGVSPRNYRIERNISEG